MPTDKNWCPTCLERCDDHPTVCTVCGDTLVVRIRAPPAGGGNSSGGIAPTSSGSLGAAAAVGINRPPGLAGVTLPLAEILGGGIGGGGGGETAPAEAMDPSAAASSSGRVASRECVASMRRTTIDGSSSVLHECAVQIVPPPSRDGNTLKRPPSVTFEATVGEFGPRPPYSVSGRAVIFCPPMGNGGRLSGETASALSPGGGGRSTVAYMERGGGVTFAAKALLAQRAGASAVVLGNNSAVWPYVMKDSKGEAVRDGLTIPVVMLSRSDGERLRRLVTSHREDDSATVRCLMTSKRKEGVECIICAEPYAVGDTMIQMPTCSHCFHEKCALMWLNGHNTCPTCRRELPAEDGEYESDRRRRARTHAGGEGDGEGLDEGQWRGIFG